MCRVVPSIFAGLLASCVASPQPTGASAVASQPFASATQRPEKSHLVDSGAPSVATSTPPRSNVAGSTPAQRAASNSEDPLGARRVDADGNDDPEPEGQGPFPTGAHFEKIGRAPLSLRQICDLTPFSGALYAVHSLNPLGADGATISRYRPEDSKHPFATAFDWNRPGEPAKGGGAGQGFLRVRAIGGRLFVPDADPPYNGFGLMD